MFFSNGTCLSNTYWAVALNEPSCLVWTLIDSYSFRRTFLNELLRTRLLNKFTQDSMPQHVGYEKQINISVKLLQKKVKKIHSFVFPCNFVFFYFLYYFMLFAFVNVSFWDVEISRFLRCCFLTLSLNL